MVGLLALILVGWAVYAVFALVCGGDGLPALVGRILSAGPVPGHVAFIMDGNRRYARSRGEAVAVGHQGGYKALLDVLRACLALGPRLKEVSVYTLAINNLGRPEEEVEALMRLAREALCELAKHDAWIVTHRVRVRVVGKLELLPDDVRRAAERIQATTASFDRATLNICMPYAAQEEMARAMRLAVETKITQRPKDGNKNITPDDIAAHLWVPTENPLDLLVRTSGVKRLSDFLLWQACGTSDSSSSSRGSGGALLLFDDTNWPAFGPMQLARSVLVYQRHIVRQWVRARLQQWASPGPAGQAATAQLAPLGSGSGAT